MLMLTITAASKSHLLVDAAYAALERCASSLHALVVDIRASLAQSADDRERAREEAYLAEATDQYDLEFRMRELDRKNRA
jgi:hypothetical protein